MRIIHQNLKAGEVKVSIENLNDLWYLSQILEPGDLVKGKAERKISIGKSEERSQVKKIFVTMTILAEKIEFHKYSDILRVNGKIKEGPEDVPREVYQTITVEIHDVIQITKDKWCSYHLEYLHEAKEKHPDFLAIVMDRDEASFAVITSQGFNIISEITGDVEKKAFKDKKKIDFYEQIIAQAKDYDARYHPKSIIIASPAFFKEDLMKLIKDDQLKKKIILATCNNTGAQGITEILKRDELKKALESARSSKEEVIVENLMKEIKLGTKAVYGIKEVEKAVNCGAVDMLIITDSMIKKSRQEETYGKIDKILKTVESNRGKIEIIDADNPAGKQLDGLGGIGAVLRYQI